MKFWSTEQEDVDLTDNPYQFGAVRSFHGSHIKFAQVMPDLEGRKMASVKTYGAVGMNSEHKEEAYRFACELYELNAGKWEPTRNI